MTDYTPTTEEVVLPPLNEEVIKQLALLGLDQMVVDVDDEKAEQFLAHVDRWLAEVKAEKAKAERERMIQILEHLGNHGVSHSERCLPRHWIVERAIEEIRGETSES